jgi:hypothetical protein
MRDNLFHGGSRMQSVFREYSPPEISIWMRVILFFVPSTIACDWHGERAIVVVFKKFRGRIYVWEEKLFEGLA